MKYFVTSHLVKIISLYNSSNVIFMINDNTERIYGFFFLKMQCRHNRT